MSFVLSHLFLSAPQVICSCLPLNHCCLSCIPSADISLCRLCVCGMMYMFSLVSFSCGFNLFIEVLRSVCVCVCVGVGGCVCGWVWVCVCACMCTCRSAVQTGKLFLFCMCRTCNGVHAWLLFEHMLLCVSL